MVYRPILTINYLFVSQSFDGTRLLYLRIFLGTRLFHCTRLIFKINFLCTCLFGVLVYLIGKSRVDHVSIYVIYIRFSISTFLALAFIDEQSDYYWLWNFYVPLSITYISKYIVYKPLSNILGSWLWLYWVVRPCVKKMIQGNFNE